MHLTKRSYLSRILFLKAEITHSYSRIFVESIKGVFVQCNCILLCSVLPDFLQRDFSGRIPDEPLPRQWAISQYFPQKLMIWR